MFRSTSPAAPSGHPDTRPRLLVAGRLSNQLAVLVGEQIDAGTLQPADRLPTEQQLAAAHSVSRTVVREAMQQRKSRQRVVSRQGSGMFVAPKPVNQLLACDPKVLDSVQDVVHVVELRRVLKGEMAALAAARATRARMVAMRRALKAIDAAAAAGQDGVVEDLAFHRAIGKATGNPQCRLLIGFLEQYLLESIRLSRGNEARRLDFMDAVRRQHLDIVDAIAAGGPARARQAACAHLLRGEQRPVQGGVISRLRRKPPRAIHSTPQGNLP